MLMSFFSNSQTYLLALMNISQKGVAIFDHIQSQHPQTEAINYMRKCKIILWPPLILVWHSSMDMDIEVQS